MRNVAFGLALLTACGGGKTSKDAAIDAPKLPACTTPVSGTNISLRPVETVPDAAMLVVSPPADPRRFVVQRNGEIRVVVDEMMQAEPFLDISEGIAAGGEQGLLGLAFHPGYAQNGQFFVYYTTRNANVVARCTVSAANPNIANETCTPILSIPDFAGNHNGGMIEFGSDGYLYIGTGDGGGGGDPQRTAQNPNNLLGKMLRIDIDSSSSGKLYGIPADNPFASSGGAPEVFILGLRNPWRWSFDKETGDLWIGDVGQNRVEELTVLRANEQKGKNLGWSVYEGSSCCDTQSDNCQQTGEQYACSTTGLTMPQDERSHDDGWISIIAGETYRGTCYPDLVGWHFYTDHASQAAGLWRARLKGDGSLEVVETNAQLPNNTASIHADARGELFLTTTNGGVFHIEAGP